MNMMPMPALAEPIVYPESDGLPMADNTKQFDWILLLVSNIRALFAGVPNVFVGGNLFWYPVEGDPDIKIAPDGLVVFGRPKGHRRSYRQWEENNVPMTVVFEVLSPSNSVSEMTNKLTFYEDHGVEEYYIYDPDRNELFVYIRWGCALRRQSPAHGFMSPRLGIRFDLSGPEMVVRRPDGTPFVLLEESEVARLLAEEHAQAERQRAEAESQRANAERHYANAERQRADTERQRADTERQRADAERQRTVRLAELSRKARRQQATVEELTELDRLEEEARPS